MKKNFSGVALLLAVGSTCLMLAGCPRTAQLEISPASLAFSDNQMERRLTLSNLGNRAAEWTLETVVRDSESSDWQAGEIDWLTINKRSGILEPGVEHITLTGQRTERAPGTYANMAVRVEATNFEKIIPISLVISPALVVSPEIVTLQPGALSAQFRLENRGQSAVTWEAQFFEGNDATVETTSLPSDMTMTPDGGALARQRSVNVRLEWTQPREDFGLRITVPGSPGHDAVVRFRFGVQLTELVAEPATLTLFYAPPGVEGGATTQPISILTLRNVGRSVLQWTATVRTYGQAADQATAPIRVQPGSDSLAAGEYVELEVVVSDPAEAIPGAGSYELAIEVQDQDGVVTVPLILEPVALPVVIASDPPDANALTYTRKSILDFGRTSIQEEFWVLNIGPLESRLYFKIRHDDEGVENPLLTDVTPMSGHTNGPDGVFPVGGRMVDSRRVRVTVDRTAMTEDVEYRDLYIEAWDEDFEARIDAVNPWHIRVRVERPPMRVEGPINRSRPPFLMRFVFTLRDTLGRVIPTRTPEDLERIQFSITEDDVLLDLNETVYYVEGPEQLKVNMVVMLDYTGSMYYAGVDDVNLRAPGEVLDEIRDAVAMFLDDLPPGYRVALMYHNDRQPLNRLIHPFSTDRESLKAALRNFEVPPQLHGTSDIWDALTEAVERIAAEDAPDTLPFDDADVRAVLFITDGHDNSSTAGASGPVSSARENRVRLYPLAYSAAISANTADLAPMAEDTGGKFYNAGDPANLVKLLGRQRSLVLAPAAFDATQNTAEFRIRNAGRNPLNWSVVEENSYLWLDVSPTSGTTPPGGESRVSVTVDPDNVPLDLARGALAIDSNDGTGSVEIMLALEPGTTDIQQLSLSLRDEPGVIWDEMQHQVVLTYVTPSQTGGSYSIAVSYETPEGNTVTGFFQDSGVFYPGDVRAGQISLHTTGIDFNYDAATWEEAVRAEVYVRADYVPRNVNQFRMRFIPMLADYMPDEVREAFEAHEMKVELAPQGLLVFDSGDPRPNWRLVPQNDNRYRLLTAREFTLPYAASGNLLRITFTNLWSFVEAASAAGFEPEFFVDMRVDNSVYFAPADSTGPSETVYFLYPSGPTNPDRPLRVSENADLAGPAQSVVILQAPGIDPEAAGVWDRDGDGLPDYMDPFPDDSAQPGRLTRPAIIRFAPNETTASVRIVNNRLDRFSWNAWIEVPTGGSLTAAHFSWFVEDEDGYEIRLAGIPGGTLLPGEEERLVLRFDPADLPSGRHAARLVLDTDIFGEETTPIEAQP